MSKTENLLNANTISYNEIISGDNIYRVPLFQRDYSWRENNWDDLWLDLSNAIESDTRHYMGSIVLIRKEKKQFEIIDGQQRITTLSILALSCIRFLNELIDSGQNEQANLERKDILMRKFIGYKSPKSLMFSPKLKLNKLNNPIYSSYLIQFHKVPNLRREAISNRRLVDSYEYFYKKLHKEIYEEQGIDGIIDFIEFVGDNLQFIQITVVDELNAYLVFETLNDRGIPLTVTDLFKNYLFSRVDEADHDHIKNKWDSILKYIKYKDFANFLRYYWISRNKLITEKELFKAIKKNIQNQADVIEIISSLETHAEVFSALSDPKDDVWKGNKETIKYLSELQLFGIKQPFALLLAAYEKFDLTTFTKIVKICSVISFRYSVISGFKTNILEQIYSRAANNIINEKSKNASQVFKDLSQLYVNDEIFTNQFIMKSIKTTSKNRLVRYIIYKLENHFSDSGKIHFDEDSGTIEHILPENPNDDWSKKFVRDTQLEFIYRLGNYTLLEKKLNKECENKMLDEKIPFYKKSKYVLANQFEYEEWNPNKLKQRQSKLAKAAKQIWKLDY
ncbi:DUF262 domain-containing HNH endonuclease family protein [Salegentibacter mishustinae]|uniref:DUF262 domain-containing protein n=1 Tax=Salegentibacter mishustinae TaxID=270918 RepID=UPI001CE0480C|nr:DUF262 domain-containing protein [Salegentibacter mishustinae]UBZ08707.1 DUF262 domain-containing HNH endonuclease family protein [Salegentibacter mishustinae]